MKSLSMLLSICITGLISSAVSAKALPLPNISPANSTLENRGAYLARAADCMACHGENYKGGLPIETPLGKIYSTNITPSVRYGIGNYTKADFKTALKKGRTPDHFLYPAMPYPSYHDVADADIDALFAYFQTVPMVDEPPEKTTHLPFPLNIRSLMLAWNLINVPATENRAGLTDKQQRGEYLVNNLEHCGTCHTPRNLTMGLDQDKYLSGAPFGKLYAPNITPDNNSGIGRWSEQDIVTYLRTGELHQRAHAGGGMGEAVFHSTRYLTDDDLSSIAAYLKAIPSMPTDNIIIPVVPERLPQPSSSSITYNLLEQQNHLAQAKQSVLATDTPKALYLSACGSCHGVDGYGQPAAHYPAIVGLRSIREQRPDRLVSVINYGVKSSLNTAPSMPGFGKDLSNAEIASITNYVRVTFGSLAHSDISADDVKRIKAAK